MSGNPFTEPGDDDRTVVRPMPGGRRMARPPGSVANQLAAASATPDGPNVEKLTTGSSPLLTAAAPLLHLLARLRNTATAPDPGLIREHTRSELRRFERAARDHGIRPDQVRQTHYALCAALDDAVINTPWGSRGPWVEQPLAETLHNDRNSGRSFFERLRSAREALPASLPVLEVMYLCLALGMTGQYRTTPDGAAQVDRVRHHVAGLIARHQPPVPATLASQTRGVDARFAPLRRNLPVWVVAVAALSWLAACYMLGLWALNADSDRVYQTALARAPAAMPALIRPPGTPPLLPAPATPSLADRLRAALPRDTPIEVLGTGGGATLRIPAFALFLPQSASIQRDSVVLNHVGNVLGTQSGAVRVLAHTDNQPVHTVKFPSNFALSQARAAAVGNALGKAMATTLPIATEGRADGEPIAPNDTVEGRQRNQRIDIVVLGRQ